METTARQTHEQAAKARENGEFGKALEFIDQAIILYQKENDKLGFSEAIADRSITLRHLAQKTGDNDYLRLAEGEMLAAVEIARVSGTKDALVLPLFNLAQSQEDLGKYNEANKNYQETIDNLSIQEGIALDPNNPAQNRPAYLANIKAHLYHSEYKSGDKSALERMQQAIEDLKNSPEPDTFSKNTWLSGALMRTAEMIKEDDINKAKEYLQQAKEMIDSDERLKIRASQWEKLAQTFK